MRFGFLLLFTTSAHGFLVQPSSPARAFFSRNDQLASAISPPPRLHSGCVLRASADSDEEMAGISATRRLGKLVPSNTVFFLCDIQERFRDLIYNMPAVISTAK